MKRPAWARKPRPDDTVTVTSFIRAGNRRQFTLKFSRVGDDIFGPYGLAEVIQELRVAALYDALTARDIVLEAAAHGKATGFLN